MFLPPPRGSVESNIVQEAYDSVELANESFDKGRYSQAIANFEKAVPVLSNVDEEYVLRCEYCMAICYAYVGRIDDAITMSRKVETQNQQYDPMILSEPELADLFQRLSRLFLLKWKRLRREDSNCFDADAYAEDAKHYLMKYLRMCQSGEGGGDLSRQLDAFRRFAAFFYSVGDYQAACSYYSQALQLAQRLHMEPVQLHCSTCIANSLVALGRLTDAIDKYKETLEFAMQTASDKAIQAQCTYRLGCALLLVRRYSDAILYFLAHERIAGDLGDLEGRLHSLDRLITAYREIGDYAEANKYSNSKDLLLAKNSDSGTAIESTTYSHDHTLRSNLSAVEQPSLLSGMNLLPAVDSFDNLLSSRTFDSGQSITNEPVANHNQPTNSMYSFAYIDDASTGPSKAPSLNELSAKQEAGHDKDENCTEPPPPPPPYCDQPPADENVAPLEEQLVKVSVEEKPKIEAPSLRTDKPEPVVVIKITKEEDGHASGNDDAPPKPVRHHHRRSVNSKVKRQAPTLPPEDPEFLDLLTRATTRRLDDQRAQLKTQPISKENMKENVVAEPALSSKHQQMVEAVVESTGNNRSPHPKVSRMPSLPADELFVMVAKAQARRMDDQRAVLRPLAVMPNGGYTLVSPDIQMVKSGNIGSATARFSASRDNVTTSPASMSVLHSGSKPSKARRFLSQLMK